MPGNGGHFSGEFRETHRLFTTLLRGAYFVICPMITLQKFVSVTVGWPRMAKVVFPEIWRMLRIRGWPGASGAFAS